MDKGKVWVFGECEDGVLRIESIKLFTVGFELAKELNTKLCAVLMGYNIESMATLATEYGVDVVFLVDSPMLRLYQSDLYAKIFHDLMEREEPEIVLFAATSIGRELAARVAAKAKTGLVSHCVDVYIEKGELIHVVPYLGNVMAKVVNEKKPKVVVMRAMKGEREREERRKGEIIRVKPDIKEGDVKAKTVEMVKEEKGGESIENAEVIVAGGWGLASEGGFELVRKLADILGAEIGGTRPAVDEGWITEDRMIGQSGKMVSPELYVALGISGAAQHILGVQDAKVILAINKDENAPIFDFCDIGIVGDAKEVVCAFLEEFKKYKDKV
ncbi:MAG: electron transfer flavoprotein subunit alpha/FixB family protein [Candidatus Methanospirareceae archaeon]